MASKQPPDSLKTAQVLTVLVPEDKSALELLALDARVSVSEYVRDLIRRDIKASGVKVGRAELEGQIGLFGGDDE